MRNQRHVLTLAATLILLGVSCSSSRGGMAAVETRSVEAVSQTTLPAVVVVSNSTVVPLATVVFTTLPAPLLPDTTGPTTPPPTAPAPTDAPIALPSDDDDPLLLRAEGFGRFSFGAPLNDVLVGSPSELGVPTSDQISRFPLVVGSRFHSEDDENAFGFPVAREFCWTQFCLIFGGADDATLKLVGWHYDGNGSAPLFGLRNIDGITLESRWSDFASAMDADPGGCYSVGGGATNDGIFLVLAGGVFGQFNADGSYEALLPDPSEVTVQSMSAGEQIEFLFADC